MPRGWRDAHKSDPREKAIGSHSSRLHPWRKIDKEEDIYPTTVVSSVGKPAATGIPAVGLESGVSEGGVEKVKRRNRFGSGVTPWSFEEGLDIVKDRFPSDSSHPRQSNETGALQSASSSMLDQSSQGNDNASKSASIVSPMSPNTSKFLENTSDTAAQLALLENKEFMKSESASPSNVTLLQSPVTKPSRGTCSLETTEVREEGRAAVNISLLSSQCQTTASTSSTEKPAGLSLLPFLGVKPDGMPLKMSLPTNSSVPSWLTMFEKFGDQRATSALKGGKTQGISDNDTEELRLLREEVNRERNGRLQVEQQLLQEREDWEQERQELTSERERLERKLEHAREQLQTAEQRARDQERRLQLQEHGFNELTTTITAAQQALEENRRSESRDWVINRDEVHVSDRSLGVGGWGRVFEGTFRGTPVAVKQIHELIVSPYNQRRFEREMIMASRCRHPCLLQFIGATNDDTSPLFVTELMETSLRVVLHERSLTSREILVISMDVARALNYLHLNRPTPIIHRDISSGNVLLWQQGETWRGKVSDYGTANFVRQQMTKAPGTPIYSAPEALTSTQSPKLDVYSFGALLCEMCTRELPDPQLKEEQIALVTNHVLRGLIRWCMQQDPEARPTMEEILNELETHSA